jgi:dihydrodipicolinate synthase/N-acetylneuraminate lyase
MKDASFRGVVPALTTPFHPDLSLDADGFATLADTVI